MKFDVGAVREQFPSLSETDNGIRRIYLDNPGGTQVPLSVVQRISDCLLHGNANIGGGFRTSDLAGEFVDEGRAAGADFVNARSTDEITFGQNMTTLTLHLSRSIGRHLKAGDEIVLTRMEHESLLGSKSRLFARPLGSRTDRTPVRCCGRSRWIAG